MKFEQKLLCLRREKGLTQLECAKKIGVSPTTFCKWERGEFRPNVINTWRLADLFGVKVSYLNEDCVAIIPEGLAEFEMERKQKKEEDERRKKEKMIEEEWAELREIYFKLKDENRVTVKWFAGSLYNQEFRDRGDYVL